MHIKSILFLLFLLNIPAIFASEPNDQQNEKRFEHIKIEEVPDGDDVSHLPSSNNYTVEEPDDDEMPSQSSR